MYKQKSFRGENCGFWSHLECSGQNPNTFSCQGLIRAAHEIKILSYCIGSLDQSRLKNGLFQES